MTKTILETPRLLLCEFIPEDADALARVLCDAETMRYYPRHFERRDADEWIARNLRRYEADGHGLWAVTLRESGDVIGDCGITLQEADGVLLPEIGYHLRRDQWGQGYATEAAQACRDWGFTQLSVAFLISLIRPENAPSRRAQRYGGMETSHPRRTPARRLSDRPHDLGPLSTRKGQPMRLWPLGKSLLGATPDPPVSAP